jgi:serine/threonine protein kinase
VIERLYGSIPEYRLDGLDAEEAGEIRRGLLARAAEPKRAHLSTLRGVVRGLQGGEDEGGDLLAVFEYEGQTLRDVLTYSRHLLDGGDAQNGALADVRMRFVVFQLRGALQSLHESGIACGGFLPSDVLLTETLWVKLGALPLIAGTSDVDKRGDRAAIPRYRDVEAVSAQSLTDRWCTGDVGNFEYLMALNAAAGRRMVRS